MVRSLFLNCVIALIGLRHSSFICSSNNNIPRITKMVHALCKHYSPSLITLPPPSVSEDGSQDPATYHPFPPPSVLAAPDVKSTLRALGFGYRADYIQRTAKMLVDTHGSSVSPSGTRECCEEWLAGLRQMSTEDAREELLKFVGVGRKVADCILLMSLNKVSQPPTPRLQSRIYAVLERSHTRGYSRLPDRYQALRAAYRRRLQS